MKQGVITGASGIAATAVNRARGGWWGWGNNNGAATGATQHSERDIQPKSSCRFAVLKQQMPAPASAVFLLCSAPVAAKKVEAAG